MTDQIEKHIRETKEKISSFKNDSVHRQELKNQQILLNQDLITLNRQFAIILSLNEELIRVLHNPEPMSLEPMEPRHPQEKKVHSRPPSEPKQEQLIHPTFERVNNDKPLEGLFSTDPKPNLATKETSPQHSINKSTSGFSLDDLMAPPKLDDILGSETSVTKVSQNVNTHALDNVLNMKDEIITFSNKSEKTNKILNLFEEKKEKTEKEIVQPTTSKSASLFDFI
jgi:hypothetical protein